nr:cuticle protein 18.6 isoform X2 [Leptinotarsa decemlineata]
MISCLLPLVLSNPLTNAYHQIELSEISTLPPPPRPYAFGYAAGRYPGHIDRTHSEVSDGSGVVQGSYSYVDPRQQIRTVEYIADKNGFRQISNQNVPDLPTDTPVVAAAKLKHLQKFSAIAQSNQVAPSQVVLPVDTKAVQFAKNKHFSLYQQIADEHARMAAELEALKRAEEASTRESVLGYGAHIN